MGVINVWEKVKLFVFKGKINTYRDIGDRLCKRINVFTLNE